ncbi:MAG TPA: hypothetical protein VF788_13055 [Pseudonocardiaceae bacterium]
MDEPPQLDHVARYPEALSFAPGLPTEQFFDVRGARKRDLQPRGCYVTPDFANPSGAMSN